MNASAFVTFLFCTGRETNSKFQTHARRAEIWEKGPVDLSIDEKRFPSGSPNKKPPLLKGGAEVRGGGIYFLNPPRLQTTVSPFDKGD